MKPAGGCVVSVIVPVRDDPAGVEALLAGLDAQTFPRDAFEFVVGDDGSEPGSLDAVQNVDGPIRIVRGPPLTSYAARNRAACVARGRILAFVDSDCVPDRRWLERGYAALDQADLVAGEVVFVCPDAPKVWSLLTIDMFLDQGRNVAKERAATANLLVRRALFDELGGFDDSLPSGGDYDFVRRAVGRGARLAFAPDAVVRHPTIDERDAFLRKISTTNRWQSARRARDRERPSLADAVKFVPVLGVAFARRSALRPVATLSRPRLRLASVTPTRRQELRALLLLYFVVSWVAGAAQIRGWVGGRRLARRAARTDRLRARAHVGAS